MEEGDPQLGLQLLDLPGEGGLGHVELFRCPGDVALVGHGEKIVQGAKLHNINTFPVWFVILYMYFIIEVKRSILGVILSPALPG